MIRVVAHGLRGLDPRLKLVMALTLGPCLWKVHVAAVAICAAIFLALVLPLTASQPVGTRMVKSMFLFILFWVGFKMTVDAVTGIPVEHIFLDGGQLATRLVALILLGLVLALSTSARALGLAIAWGLRPIVGKERAWQVALSLALMVHFLPICLATLTQVREVLGRRCPGSGIPTLLRVLPQAVIRNLGQKTWSQTLAVASRRLETPDAWEADFAWSGRDWICAGFFAVAIPLLFIF